MSIVAAQRTMNWRESQIALLGKDAFNKLEAQKRKERRQRAKQRLQPQQQPIEHKEEYKQELQDIVNILNSEINKPKLPLPQVRALIEAKASIAKSRKAENCDDLLKQVFQAKSEYLASQNPPKTIKKSSVSQQLTKVVNLYKKMTGSSADCTDFEFLRDTDKIINFINTNWKTPNSRNSQIQAISSILQALGGYDREYKFYSKYSTDKRKEINKTANENELTEKEAKNILPWNDIKDLYKQVADKPNKALIALYTLMPPRRVEDISLLTIIDDEKANPSNLNYLVIDKNKKPLKIVYLRYKTDKTYGRQNIKIPAKLSSILQDYINTYAIKLGNPLFPTANNGYYKNFSEIVSNTFKKYTGKGITANLLRHSFISDFLSKKRTIAKKKEIAWLMGHNINSQGQYDRIDL